LAGPWIALWANGKGERVRFERAGVHLAIALDPLLAALEGRLQGIGNSIQEFLESAGSPTRGQQLSHLRVLELPTLAQLRISFIYLDELGFTFESLHGLLQVIDVELAEIERVAVSGFIGPDLDDRLRGLNPVLHSVSELIAIVRPRIRRAANARSLKPLMEPFDSQEKHNT